MGVVEIRSHLTSSVVERKVGGCDLLDFRILPVASGLSIKQERALRKWKNKLNGYLGKALEWEESKSFQVNYQCMHISQMTLSFLCELTWVGYIYYYPPCLVQTRDRQRRHKI